MVPLIVALLLALPLTGQGCPYEGSDHRLLGHLAWIMHDFSGGKRKGALKD
jgi:hypothetical protein